MPRLFVAGCSFSDYTTDLGIRPDLIQTYGQLLAQKLGYEYWHEAAGCGSNYRIWRTISNHVIDGNLRPDDILLVQYTELSRQEFWSAIPDPTIQGTVSKPLSDYGPEGGTILRYKLGSGAWQLQKQVKAFFQMYEEGYVGTEWSKLQWKTQHFCFQHMLLNCNIKTIFMRTRMSPHGHDEILEQFVANLYKEPDEYIQDNKTWLSPDDKWHLSQYGHDAMAENIYQHILTNGM